MFALTEQPRRLAILGAGPIGCEMAQAFARLGTEVTLIDQAAQVLPQEDADAAAIVGRRLTADGVILRLGATIRAASPAGLDITSGSAAGFAGGAGLPPSGKSSADHRSSSVGGQPCDHILIAAGRRPNIDHLDLPAAGVAFDHRRGHRRRSSAHDEPADLCRRRRLLALQVHPRRRCAWRGSCIRNALFFGRARASALVIPWCTYTDPEVAHVGAYDGETITIPLADVDRAVVDEETDGFVRVHHERGRLRGCTVVASRAGERSPSPRTR